MSNSLYNPMTVLGKTAKPFEHPYKGTVVDVDSDPQYMGRIKVSIPELYGDYQEGSEGTLPWIYPRYFGKFNNKFELDVPEKGEIVEVEFPYKNVYLGYYTNRPIFKSVFDDLIAIDPDLGQVLKEIFAGEHYPSVYGKFDKNLTGWYIDKITDELCLIQGTTKASVKLNTEGSLIVSCPKHMIFTAGENIEFHAGLSYSLEAGENIALSAGTAYSLSVPDATVAIDNTLTLTASTVEATATVNLTGDLSVTGTIQATVDAIADGISLIGHTHTVPQSPAGTQESAPPTK